MATSARKHTIPAALETPRRQAIVDGFASVNDIVPVANVTERAQLLAGLGWTPSATRPLVISRADAPDGARFEYTMDGSVWRALGGDARANISSGAFGAGWSAVSGAGNAPRVRRQGNMVFLFGSMSVGSGASMNDILTIPAGFTPDDASTTIIGTSSILPNGGTAGTRALAISNGRILAPANYGVGSPAIGGVVPLGGCFWFIA